MANRENLRIVFMGTPEFAVASLKALCDNKFIVVAVVTVADKPAGRGQKLSTSPVKDFALLNNIPILQPTNLKDSSFIEELKSFNANLQIVVAFRMLPEIIWAMPSLGTVNLHGSLLPHYRGAAPINWVVINGEKTTGITTFFLEHKIDTGNIIFREEIPISNDDSAGSLHDRMMYAGAALVIKTTNVILSENTPSISQSDLINNDEVLKIAPKISRDDCRINWMKTAYELYNFIRGLCPYPTAWSELVIENEAPLSAKIFSSKIDVQNHNYVPGKIIIEGKETLKVACVNGFLIVIEIQIAGKKRMLSSEFLKGFKSNQILYFK